MSLFLHFAELNDALAATTKKLEKRAFIADYLRTLPIPDAGRAALWLSGTPFPETDRRVLSIGGSLLSKAVAELSGASQTDMSAAYRRHGDIGSAAADLLYGRAPTTASITLADVESALAAIAEARGPTPKLRLLLALLARATPDEAKYLIKLATGDMRTGVKQSLVEEAIAEAWSATTAAVRNADMLLGSLPEVVALAAAGRLDHARMKLFHPIGFMLASPVPSTEEAIARFTEEIAAEQHLLAPEIAKNLAQDFSEGESDAGNPTGTSFVSGHDFSRAVKGPKKKRALAPEYHSPGREEAPSPFDNSPNEEPQNIVREISPALRAAQLEDKFDGIRAQLHVDNTQVALYSRNRDDLSESFPDLVTAFSGIAEPAILDGEILAWNPATQRALSFSTLAQRLGRKRVSPEMLRDIPVVLVVFRHPLP